MGSREATYERDSVEGPLGSDPQSAREPGTEELQADKAGSNFTIKTESHQDSKSYQEILKNATPSEEAVSPPSNPLFNPSYNADTPSFLR